MTAHITLQKLSSENFSDYELLTRCAGIGGCYCSFWHQNWNSMAQWESQQRDHPEWNRNLVFEKMRSGFHMGALAYQDGKLAAWISVGPLIDFHWTWRRVVQVGEASKSTAGITCFAVAENQRGQGLQAKILEAMKEYGRTQGWSVIEGYPFDASALERHGKGVIWPGLPTGFENAGFQRVSAHWLSKLEAERSIYQFAL